MTHTSAIHVAITMHPELQQKQMHQNTKVWNKMAVWLHFMNVWMKWDASSQVKVLWYLTSTQSLDKSRYWKLGLYLIGSTGIIWNQLQTISHCVDKTSFSLKCKVKIVYPLNSDWKDCSDWLETITIVRHRHLQSRLFDIDFYQGLCWDTISQYLDVWRWQRWSTWKLEKNPDDCV